MSEYVLDYVWAFALALIITFALTPLVKRFAVAVGAIDKPDARKVHHGAIPRLGGLAIFLGYVGSVLFNDSIPHDHKLFGFVLGTVILVLVGIWDDIKQIEPKTKLMGQIIAAAILVAYDIRVDFINLPWGGVVYLKYWAIPLTIFWIVGFTNIVNLIDGLDGLAAGISVMGAVKTAAMIALVVPAIVLGLPILDTLFAIVRRKISGRPIFKPDKGHVHHRLLAQGLTQKQAVLLMYAVTALFGGVSVIVAEVNAWVGATLVLVIFLCSIYIARRLGVIMHSDAAGHPLPRPTIERSDSDDTISFDRDELAKALENTDDSHKE